MYPEPPHTCVVLSSSDTLETQEWKLRTLNVISSVYSNTSEAELREQSNSFHSGFFFFFMCNVKLDVPLSYWDTLCFSSQREKCRFSETSQ